MGGNLAAFQMTERIMSKTILIPTDLSVASLNTLKLALNRQGEGGVKAVLMHARRMPSGISDLLFYSPQRTLREHMDEPFLEALAVLRNRYERTLLQVEVVLFHGNTRSAFDQFLRSHAVDEVHVQRGARPTFRGEAFDPLPFIRDCAVPVVEEVLEQPRTEVSADHLEVLFAQ